MAVRIPGVGTPVNVGEVELKSADWNDSHKYHISLATESFKSSILNGIRQAIDRESVFSGDGDDIFVEAYTTENGRNGSVETFFKQDYLNQKALFDTNKYKYNVIDYSEESNLVIFDIYADSVNDVALTDSANSVFCWKLEDGLWRIYSFKETNTLQNWKRVMSMLFDDGVDNASNPNNVTNMTQIRSNYADYNDENFYVFNGIRPGISSTTSAEALFNISATQNLRFPLVYSLSTRNTGGSTARLFSNTGEEFFVNSSTSSGTPIDHRFDTTVFTRNSKDTFRIQLTTSSGTNQATRVRGIVFTGNNTMSLDSSDLPETRFSQVFRISATLPDTDTYPMFVVQRILEHNIPVIFQKPTTKNIGKSIVVDGSRGEYKLIQDFTDVSFIEIDADSVHGFEELFDTRLEKKNASTWVLKLRKYYTKNVGTSRLVNCLFFGHDPNILRFTNITALRTNIPRLLGKKAVYASQEVIDSTTNQQREYIGTFTNTTNNQGVLSWAEAGPSTIGMSYAYEKPIGTTLLSAAGTFDNRFSDNSSLDSDNPSNLKMIVNSTSTNFRTGGIRGLFLFNEGTITWTTSGDSQVTRENTDFTEDHSIPKFSSVIIPDPALIETSWLEESNLENFTEMIPTKLLVKLEPNSSIKGFGFKGLKIKEDEEESS